MATTDLTCTGYTSGNFRYSTTSVLSDIQTNDADTAYVLSLQNENRSGKFSHTSLPASASSVSAGTVYALERESRNNTGQCNIWDGVGWTGLQDINASWAYYYASWNASLMTVALVNATDIGCSCKGGAGEDARCTYHFLRVTYEEGGPWFQVLSSLIGPALLGAQLTLPIICSAAKSALNPLATATGSLVRYDDDEIHKMWLSYKDHEYKFQTYFDLGSAKITL